MSERDGPFHFEVDQVRRLRDVLESAGYTDRGISETLRGEQLAGLGAKKIKPLLRRTAGGSPLETLIRLFVLGAAVERPAAVRALSPLPVEDMVELGLLRTEGASLRATAELRCFRHLIVASDLSPGRGPALRADHVMGISPSTLTLASLTIRRSNGAALDLGSGSGFQAFLAAAHSKAVVAVDRNPRAVAFARFNAALNGLDAVECLEGDLFEAVEGRTFDLVVSNPPFIISPDRSFYFLHSGLLGDEVCRRIVRQAPGRLNDGGWCQLMANWAVLGGQEPSRRLAGWFQDSGCDAWVIHQGTTPADEYAATWIETGDDPSAYEREFDRWMAHYDELGVEAVGAGLITLRRRRTGPHWFRFDDAPRGMTFPCGDDVARGFELRDRLERMGDRGLLDARLRLAADVRLEEQLRATGGRWEVVAAELHRVGGLAYAGTIDPQGASVLARCDGTRPLGALLAELARSLDQDPDSVTSAALGVVHRLVEWGFLVPDDDGAV